jgi:pantetheine-phosphate adenylyltransferase
MKRAAIYPGTFDPLTLGHFDVIQRAAQLFEKLIVAVADNAGKKCLFSLEERLQLVRDAVKGFPGVEVAPFSGLLVHYARKSNVSVLVRGLRAFSDFEYEFQMALSNRKLAPDVETMFLMTSEAYSYISSSVVREVAELGGDTTELVPPNVQAALVRKLRKGHPAA